MKFISLLCFAIGATLFPFVTKLYNITEVYTKPCFQSMCAVYILSLALFLVYIRGLLLQVSIRSVFLGFLFGCATKISLSDSGWHVFGWYMSFMVIFHFSEFMTLAIVNPATVTTDSFMLNHSLEYGIAAVGSWIEFFLEYWMFPTLKGQYWISICGVIFCVVGEILRKCAMFTAKTNFSHIVEETRRNDHELVTHGIYSYCRHPSYVGWFWFAIGTQLILINPVCIILYTIVSWRFFNQRIFIEEVILLQFFGLAYYNYQQNVGTGLPFIDGFIADSNDVKNF